MRASERYPRFLRKSLLALLFALLLLLFTLLLLFLALLLLLFLALLLLFALFLALLLLLFLFGVQRQVDGEASALVLLAFHGDEPVVAVDDLLHHRQADAQAAAFARAAGVGAPEAAEHHLRLLGLTVMVPPSGV